MAVNRIIKLGKYFLVIFFLPFSAMAQNYVDVLKIGYGQTFQNEFKETESHTKISSFKTGITIPIPINENQALITGADFIYNDLKLFPGTESTNLYSTSLTLGMASTWSERWSTTLVLLPKIASDLRHV